MKKDAPLPSPRRSQRFSPPDDPSKSTGERFKDLLEGSDNDTVTREQSERNDIRQKCRSDLLSCARDSMTAMSVQDVEDYMKGMTDAGLVAFKDEKVKTQKLREHEATFVPNFIKETHEAGSYALSIIAEAEHKEWISKESADRWRRERLKAGRWTERRAFIGSKTFKGELDMWKKNWQELHDDLTLLKNRKKALGISANDEKGIRQLAALKGSDYEKAKVPKKRILVHEALAALSAWGKDSFAKKNTGTMRALHAKAERQLQDAVHHELISPELKARLLRQMFELHEPKVIEDFLSGRGAQPLIKLERGWTQMRNKFYALKDRCATNGTPRSFHFVHITVFLKMRFSQQQSYLTEAEHRFTDIHKEPELFLRIRHEMDTKDWDAADALLARAEGKNWSTEDLEKLRSMKEFLRTHRPSDSMKEKEQSPTDEELVGELRGLVSGLPSAYQDLYAEAMHRGYNFFWVLSTLHYNRVWCWNHRYLDDEREKALREEADAQTQNRIDNGHTKTHEADSLMGRFSGERFAARDQSGLKAAQTLITNGQQSKHALFKSMEDNGANETSSGSRDYWYWTSAIDVQVPYIQHKEVVMQTNPQIKRLMREMQKRNLSFTMSGPVERKNKTVLGSAPGKNAAEPQLAMAA